jgi:hypothetical protein
VFEATKPDHVPNPLAFRSFIKDDDGGNVENIGHPKAARHESSTAY